MLFQHKKHCKKKSLQSFTSDINAYNFIMWYIKIIYILNVNKQLIICLQIYIYYSLLEVSVCGKRQSTSQLDCGGQKITFEISSRDKNFCLYVETRYWTKVTKFIWLWRSHLYLMNQLSRPKLRHFSWTEYKKLIRKITLCSKDLFDVSVCVC